MRTSIPCLVICGLVALGCGKASDDSGNPSTMDGHGGAWKTDGDCDDVVGTDSTGDTHDPDGIDSDGIDPDGIEFNDIASDGIEPDGVEPDASAPDVLAPDGSAPDAFEAVVLTCAYYCDFVQKSCGDSGPNSQYASEDACNAYCKTAGQFPLGTSDDQAGNTLGCRIYHAAVAGKNAVSAATHCPHAGPSGANVCGTWCENYCDLAETSCTDNLALFASPELCATACANVANTGLWGDTTGDTVQCRIYHLGVAGGDKAGGSDTLHCNHGGIDGGGVCSEAIPPAPTCETYCEAVTAVCTGEKAQYDDQTACMTYCTIAAIAVGNNADTTGDTLGCRTYHAGVAVGSPATHCVHAGPTGGDVCGTWCEAFCNADLAVCTGALTQYTSKGDCMSACEAFNTDAEVGATDGDSLQCRAYHLGVAASDVAGGSATTHCDHTGEDGGGVCVDPIPAPTCAAYCQAVTAVCTDENAQYADEAACVTYCTAAAIALGNTGDTAGDTLGCRTYHAGVAVGGPATHCVHAGPTGGDVCGTWCEAFCNADLAVCMGALTQYTSKGDCMSACETFNTDAEVGATDGDSLQCRAYHLGVAASDVAGGSATTHCDHTGEDGGGVCVDPIPAPTCAAYCTAVTYACTGAEAQYEDESACLSYCQTWAAFPIGTATDTAGNTVGCRTYHAVAAASDATTHCIHAGPTGGDVCGAWCENYCDLATKNCTLENALYTGAAKCAEVCSSFSNVAPAGSVDGDSVQCRIYHLGLAGSDQAGGSGTTHCVMGAMDGGDVCVFATTFPGDVCATPIIVGPLPYKASGDTSEGVNDYAIDADCGKGGAGSKDHVYDFTPLADIKVTVSLNANYDSILYVVSDCATANTTCLGATDEFGSGLNEKVILDAKAGVTYHIIVDGYDDVADQSGTYSLEVVEVALIDGNMCVNPFIVGPLPYVSSDDTSTATNEHSTQDDDCGFLVDGVGGASSDLIYEFTAPETEDYDVSLSATTFDSVVYILKTCDSSASCQGSDDQEGIDQKETVILSATQGVTYFIVVDGHSNLTNEQGLFTLTVKAKVLIPPVGIGPKPVDLGSASNFVILTKSGIDTVPTSKVTGNIGVSPIDSTGITGFSLAMDSTNVFSTSTQVAGKVYAADYTPPTPSNMTIAVSAMETAFTDAAGRTLPDFTELGAGDISGLILVPGLYKWGTGVLISTNVTLAGGPNDVWIFQVSKGITQASNTKILLAGGALAKNIFWQAYGAVAIDTGAHFEGVILSQTEITLATGASINGRLMAQTAVTLDAATVTQPAP